MILDGAPVIVDPEQAVEMVTGLLADQGFAFGKPKPKHERALDLSGELRSIYDAVTEDCTVDDVAANAEMPPARVASGLAELELEGQAGIPNYFPDVAGTVFRVVTFPPNAAGLFAADFDFGAAIAEAQEKLSDLVSN